MSRTHYNILKQERFMVGENLQVEVLKQIKVRLSQCSCAGDTFTTYISHRDMLHFFKGICKWSLLGVTVVWQQVKVCREVFVFNILKFYNMKCTLNFYVENSAKHEEVIVFLLWLLLGGAVWRFSCLGAMDLIINIEMEYCFFELHGKKNTKLFRNQVWPGIWYCIQHQY